MLQIALLQTMTLLFIHRYMVEPIHDFNFVCLFSKLTSDEEGVASNPSFSFQKLYGPKEENHQGMDQVHCLDLSLERYVLRGRARCSTSRRVRGPLRCHGLQSPGGPRRGWDTGRFAAAPFMSTSAGWFVPTPSRYRRSSFA